MDIRLSVTRIVETWLNEIRIWYTCVQVGRHSSAYICNCWWTKRTCERKLFKTTRREMSRLCRRNLKIINLCSSYYIKRTVNWLEKYSNLTYAILFNISLDHYYLWSVIKMEFHISVILPISAHEFWIHLRIYSCCRIYIYVINQTNAIIGKKVPHRMIDRIDVASWRSRAHARRNDDPGLEYAWLAARLRNYI